MVRLDRAEGAQVHRRRSALFGACLLGAGPAEHHGGNRRPHDTHAGNQEEGQE